MADQQMDIDSIRQRYEDLKTRKIQAETSLAHAESRLAELKQQALEKYDTDDVAELKTKLQEMENENRQKQSEYIQSLDTIENQLADVEKKYAAIDADSEQP